MRKSIFAVIAVFIIIFGVVWWGVHKGNWDLKSGPLGKFFQSGSSSGTAEGDEEITRTIEKKDSETGEDASFIKRGLAIKVYKVSRGTFEDVLPTMGSVKGLITRKMNFEVPGLVEKINFRQGDLVRKGDVLASLNKREATLKVDFNQAKLKSAMTAVSQADKKLKMFQQLFEIGAVSKLKLSEVEAEAATASHQMEAAQVELASAQQELTKTEIRAPADGVLSAREVEEGEFVSASLPKALEMVEIEVVYAEVGIVERDVTKVKIGQLARVYVDAYADLPFDGIIDNIYPSLSEKTRTLPVEIRVDNSRRLLMPGMFARAEVILFEKPGVISIPRVSIKKNEDTAIVYVIDEQTNAAAERLVELGYESTDYVEIKRGLQEGDLVAISNVEGLTSGTPVQITEIQVREI